MNECGTEIIDYSSQIVPTLSCPISYLYIIYDLYQETGV